MTITPADCPRCQRIGALFPDGWQKAGPSPEIGLWTHEGHFGLWRCGACGALWAAVFDQYSAYYICHPVPAELQACVRGDASPGAVLRLLEAPGLHWLIEAYFSRGVYDLAEGANTLVAAMGRDKLTEAEMARLLAGLTGVFRRAESIRRTDAAAPPVRLRDARPLVRLIEREGLTRESEGGLESSPRESMRYSARAILRGLLAVQWPVMVLDGASRHRLERLSGIRREPLKAPQNESLPVATKDEAVDLFMLELGKEEPTERHIRSMLALFRRLDTGNAMSRRLRADYLSLLTKLRDAGQVPETCLPEVDEWIARHGYPPKSPKPAARQKSPPLAPSLAPVIAAPGPAVEERADDRPSLANLLKSHLALLAGSTALIASGGFLLGEFLIPAGAFLLGVLLYGVWFFAFFALVACCCLACGRRAVAVCGAAVMLGSLALGHYLAYAWDGEEWAARYYARQAAEGTPAFDWRELPRRELVQRMVAERLGEPAAGGPVDLLRLRAQQGSLMLVSQRWSTLPDRGERQGWEMWAGWLGQLLAALAATGALFRMIWAEGQSSESPEGHGRQ
ncbi:MAG TPA: hypothetical protein VI457_04100 [Methylococcaceae bacterium]|nr:hypothetical protein [Methylococcaceae bacterium]